MNEAMYQGGEPLDDVVVEEEQHDAFETERRKHWQESVFAVGLVDISWQSHHRSRNRHNHNNSSSDDSTEFGGGGGDLCCEDERGCHIGCSAVCCRCFDRVGNFVVLLWTPATTVQRNGQQPEELHLPQPLLLLGPYWVVACCLTFPLILAVSALTFAVSVRNRSLVWIVSWAVPSVLLVVSLALTSFRNPGIMFRYTQAPNEEWIWNSQALTYRPPDNKYDRECAAVIEGFDHTCPWTGNAIGKRNMATFKAFVILVFSCLLFDVMLLSGQV